MPVLAPGTGFQGLGSLGLALFRAVADCAVRLFGDDCPAGGGTAEPVVCSHIMNQRDCHVF